MRDKLEFISNQLQNKNFSWFEEHGIVYKDKGDCWILNYIQHADKNEFNILTRGLVIGKDGKIHSCPFFRFFNYGEPLAAPIDFLNSSLIEKLDGSLVSVYFPESVEKPQWHFRNLMSVSKQDRNFAIKGLTCDEEYLLLMAVEPYLKHIKFPDKLKEYTLIFEFISQVNPIITRYESHQYGLYLIGARHLPTLEELSEDELDSLGLELNVRRPRRWKASSYEEVIQMMSNFPKDYEGFVGRDNTTGARNKFKSEDYLRRHRLLKRMSYKRLIPLWLSGEKDEITSYFPETILIFDKISESYHRFLYEAIDKIRFWQNKNVPRKEVALGVIGKESKYISSLIFKFIDTKDNLDNQVAEYIRAMRVEVLIEAWNLKEELLEKIADTISINLEQF